MNQKLKKRSEREKFTTLSIPTSLIMKIEERIKGTAFTSVTSYVTYVLTKIVAEEEEEFEKPFTKEDEEKVKARLRALGYIQ